VIVSAASLFALLIDIFTGHAISWIFGAVFVVASTYAALQVRRDDRLAAVITPPLVFAVLVIAYDFVSTSGDFLAKALGGIGGLLDDGPMLWIGAGLPLAIVGFRVWQERRLRPAAPPTVAAPADAAPADAARPTTIRPAPAPTGLAGLEPVELSGPDEAPAAEQTASAPPPS
jgi:hypothetical protein